MLIRDWRLQVGKSGKRRVEHALHAPPKSLTSWSGDPFDDRVSDPADRHGFPGDPYAPTCALSPTLCRGRPSPRLCGPLEPRDDPYELPCGLLSVPPAVAGRITQRVE